MIWFDRCYIAEGHMPGESALDDLGHGRWLVDTVQDGMLVAQWEVLTWNGAVGVNVCKRIYFFRRLQTFFWNSRRPLAGPRMTTRMAASVGKIKVNTMSATVVCLDHAVPQTFSFGLVPLCLEYFRRGLLLCIVCALAVLQPKTFFAIASLRCCATKL